MENTLIHEISRELNIKQCSDTETEWYYRLIYSALGKIALASLWDYPENNNFVSIQHLKSKINKSLEAFLSIYPELQDIIKQNHNQLIDNIYSIYKRTGYLYHSPNKISPSISVSANGNNITFYRTSNPNIKVWMSGLGLYSSIKNLDTDLSLKNMFELQDKSMETVLNDFLSQNDWYSKDWPSQTQFLRITPPFTQGYWKEIPDKNGIISLARYRYGHIKSIYVFYKYENGRPFQKLIPDWQIQDFRSDKFNNGEYRRIANALLMHNDTRPIIQAKIDTNLVLIDVGYRLPPTEEDFFQLYSWPTNNDSLNFKRKMEKSVYFEFKNILKTIGYKITEV